MTGFAQRVKKSILKKRAQMDDANRGICYILRNPPPGQKKTKLADIRKVVRKMDGKKPTIAAISLAAITYKAEKGQRGRPKGARATTKAEDQRLLKLFFKLRPPGCGVDSRQIYDNMCKTMQAKIGRDTIRRSFGISTS